MSDEVKKLNRRIKELRKMIKGEENEDVINGINLGILLLQRKLINIKIDELTDKEN